MDTEDLKRERETVPSMEEELRLQISNLKTHIDGLSTGRLNRLATSVNHERTAEEYGRERELLLKKLTEVPGPRPLCIDWERNEQELRSCLEVEHTPDTLPILLHQFFCDRVSYLIHLKHTLLVRWARFASRPSVVAKLNDSFQELMSLINAEYDDAVSRARRLSVARDCLLATKPPPLSTVQREDVLIYLRWLVGHLHSTKRLSAAVSMVRWIPHVHLERMQAAARQGVKVIPAPLIQSHLPSTTPHAHPHHTEASEGSSVLLGPRDNRPVNNFRVRSDSLFGLGLVSRSMPELSTVCTAGYHPLFSQLLKTYNLGLGLSGGARSAADELEMYYQVEQKFHIVFRAQERLSTYHAYGMSSADPIITSLGGNNGRDALSQKVFKKPSNWLEFNTLKAAKHPLHVKAVLHMRDKVTITDALLGLQSKCLHMSSEGRTLYALKQHVVTTIYHKAVSSLSTKSEKDTLIIWKGIYQGLDARNPLDPPTEEEESAQVELDVNWDGMMRESSSVFMTSVPGESGTSKGDSVAVPTSTTQESPRLSVHRESTAPVKPRSGFTIPSALKLINMNKGREISARAHSAPKNGFSAFVLLRHLHTRDLMRKCVGVLNYLRSVERTLVINCGGLSLSTEGNSQNSTYHSQAHLYHTPADYRIDSEEFMRFKAVENHDDFYSSEDGLHKVSDAKGVPIVYDIALEDLKSLESELLLLGSYYLQKSGRVKGAKRGVKTESDVEKLACFEVDRFAILLDLWTCEEQYLQAKKKLVDCYMEAYHLTPDPHERAHLASVVYDIITSRPRYNPDAVYFSDCYHDEIDLLRTHLELMESVLSRQLMDERDYCQLMGNSLSGTSLASGQFGMPLPLVAKQQVSLIGEESTLCPAFLLEVCPSLSMASHLYYALKGASEEATHLTALSTSTSSNAVSSVAVEMAVLQSAQEELDRFTQLGSSYSRDTQKHLFSEAYVEHPGFVSELCAHMDQEVVADSNLSQSEKLPRQVDVWCRCLEGVSLRHRLLLAAQETEVAYRVYHSQLVALDQDGCHAHVRMTDFDHSAKLTVTHDLDELMKAAISGKQDEASLDRYTPAENCLGIHELDSSHIGKFSFQTRNDTLQQLSPTALENLRTTLMVQVSTRQCLATASQHHTALLLVTDVGCTAATDNITASTRSLQLAATGSLQQDSTGSVRSFKGAQTASASSSWEKQIRKKSFVSIQRYKAPLRDLMLSEYTEKPATVVRSSEEAQKAQRELIVKYCFNVSKAFSSTSLKTQLLHSYTKLSQLLEDCPAVREAFFVYGKPKELTEVFPVDEVSQPAPFSLVKDPRQHQARPHTLMSGDGKQLTNLWYIPHPTEVVRMLSHLDSITDCRDILTTVVKVVTRFVHIFMYFCAYAQLGIQKDSHHGNRVGAEWGGLEGIGRELSNLSDEISRLKDATDPQKVCAYLEGRCQLLSWCLHLVVKWCLPQTFFSKGRKEAYHVVRHHSVAILDRMSDKNQIPLGFPCFSVPEPVDVHNSHTLADAFSWRKFLSHSQILDPLWKSKCFSLKDDIHSLLGLLLPEDRLVAQGDVIGMSVQVDEALQSHHRYQVATAGSTGNTYKDDGTPKHPASSLEKTQTLSITGAINKGLRLPAFVSPAASLRRTCEATTSSLPSQLSSSLAISSAAFVQSSSHRKMKSGWLLFQPSVAIELALKYVTLSATVETLKWEWSARVLGSFLPSGHVKDSRELDLIQEMYKMRVQEPSLAAVKSVGDSCSIIQDGEDGVSTRSGPMETGLLGGQAKHCSELQLISTQYTHLTELVRMQLVREQIRHVMRLQNAVLAELEQDEDVLPITVWKKASFKEPPAVMKPRIGEVFHRKFLNIATIDGGKYSLSKKDWNGLMMQLETSVLAREKEVYDIYSTFYEAILMHLHISQYHMERELEHYKAAACARLMQSRDEARVLLAQDTRDLTLEITALRTRISQLEEDLVSSRERVAHDVQSRYKELVERTFSSSTSIKSRFEDYRQMLYSDCLDALQDVRHEAAASMGKMKQRLCLVDQAGGEGCGVVQEQLKGVEAGLIQKENSALSKSLCQINVVSSWQKAQLLASHDARMAELEGEVDRVKRELTETKVAAKEEKRLLRQQVETLQKVLFRTEKDVDAIQKQLADEKNKRIALSKSMVKSQDNALVKTDTLQEFQVDDLVCKLEEKEQQLKALKEEGAQQQKMVEAEQAKARRAVRDIKKQLSHERVLKLDAFHHFEDMVAKAHSQDMMKAVQTCPRTADSRRAHCSSAVISRPKASHPGPRRNTLKNHSHSDFTSLKQDSHT